eukprot:3940651-Rhodomonas_salina.4
MTRGKQLKAREQKKRATTAIVREVGSGHRLARTRRGMRTASPISGSQIADLNIEHFSAKNKNWDRGCVCWVRRVPYPHSPSAVAPSLCIHGATDLEVR